MGDPLTRLEGGAAPKRGQLRLVVAGVSGLDRLELERNAHWVEKALGCRTVWVDRARAAAEDIRRAREAEAVPIAMVGGPLEDVELLVLLRALGSAEGPAPLVLLVASPWEEHGKRALEAGCCDALEREAWSGDDLVRSLRLAFELARRQRAERDLTALRERSGTVPEWADEARRYAGSGRLLVSASHDLSNLLQPILGHAELLTTLHTTDTVSGRYARLVEQAASLAAALVRRLLQLGRAGDRGFRDVDPDGAIEAVDGLLCLMLGAKTRFDCFLGAPGSRLWLPEGAVEQIVLNLAGNAREAMPSGGRVVLRTRRTPDVWRLEIEDSGAGIDASRLERAFDSGYTTKQHQRGAGLGLWIVRSLVEEAGGEVKLESEVGRGTRAVVEIPLHKSAMPDPE